jgi:membrane-associated protease RseP (regulator of RpoE activity)
MANEYNYERENEQAEFYNRVYAVNEPKKESPLINVVFFILTFISTTFAGVSWLGKDPFQLNNFASGLTYSLLIMAVITAHEFGHYFAAQAHKVKVTLPYYIPFPIPFLNPFGTMGAVIRMKQRFYSRKALFDIAVAGPIAGWIVSVIILIIGFLTLPPVDYLYSIHPGYAEDGVSLSGLTFGYNIAFWALEKLFVPANGFMPPMNEMYHYPFLCVGWFGLLITALNMMPAGQLDGGHISYTMFSYKIHSFIAYLVFTGLLFFGIPGVFDIIAEWQQIPFRFGFGSAGWFIWAIMLFFIIKIKHPPIVPEEDPPLSAARMAAGWFTFFIFVVSFTPVFAYES